MGRAGKRIQTWLENTPRDAPIEEVEAVIQRYFPGLFVNKSGSHIVVTDERLVGFSDFGALGEFTVPVKRGQRVKGFYLKRLARAVTIIMDLERDKDENSGARL
jgi:hypothetical protein